MSDDDSLGSAGDDDVQVAAQISSMLKPLTKKQSKMGKRLSALEGVVAKMAAQLDEPARSCGARSRRRPPRSAKALRADVAQRAEDDRLRAAVRRSAGALRAAADEQRGPGAAPAETRRASDADCGRTAQREGRWRRRPRETPIALWLGARSAGLLTDEFPARERQLIHHRRSAPPPHDVAGRADGHARAILESLGSRGQRV